MRASAVVFAYHDVGVRCLEALLDGGVDVRLVVTHDDDPRRAGAAVRREWRPSSERLERESTRRTRGITERALSLQGTSARCLSRRRFRRDPSKDFALSALRLPMP